MTKHLLSGHARFRSEYFEHESDFLQALARDGQNPSALYIGCSDSRVVPELLTTSRPGELFVVRNIANVVPSFDHADASVGAAIEYAVAVLKVPHVIVCGHDKCGGVKAALDGVDKLAAHKSLHEWVSEILPAATRAREIEKGDDKALLRCAVEENVLYSMENLTTYPAVAAALAAHKLEFHGWVFDIDAGKLRVYDVTAQEFVEAAVVAH
ncbi:MAG: carbonic anhydrase [Deltaproteobacteria bacterium]|nr:carbonic anhydrase [Deltaproteobacteria bacterium]